MIAIPFVYFSCLFIHTYYKKGFDLSAYLVLIYVVISFFSIIIDLNDLRSFDSKYYDISIDGAFLYCFLLTLVFWPFYKTKFNTIQTIKLYNPKIFDFIVYMFSISFIMLIIISYKSIINILSGDLAELRKLHNQGENVFELEISGGPILIFINMLSMYSIIMLLFYFYSICFLKKSKWFNIMILLSSLSIVVMGILGIDRSKTIYWILTYGAMVVLFWKHMQKKQRAQIKKITIVVVCLLLSYFITLTIARFGERDSGAEGGLISYAGQSYINFCMFYDTVNYSEFSLQKIFPLYYSLFVDNGIKTSADLNNDISLKTGKFISVFATFAGDIMVASGKIATIIYCIFYSLFTRKIIMIKSKTIYFNKLIFIFCLLLVPLLGEFSYYYNNHYRVIMMSLFMIYALFESIELNKKIKK